MAFTYAPGTDRGKVRLRIGDRVEATAIFEDDEIDAFLESEGSVPLAAAAALETIAADQALVLKKLKLEMGALETDGPAVAKALLDTARQIREAEGDSGACDIAEMVVDDFSAGERMYKQRQRGWS